MLHRRLILLMVLWCSVPCSAQSRLDTTTVKIASISFVPVKWDKQANWNRLASFCRQASAAGAKILITPEGILEGYLINEVLRSKERPQIDQRFLEISETQDGPFVTKVRNLAKELRVHLILGYSERDRDWIYGSAMWIGPDGQIIHNHRKTHLAEGYFDPPFYRPGWETNAFDTEYGRMGMMICYERQVPEVARALAADGARFIVVPSYGSRGEWNDAMIRTRARENGASMIFCHPQQSLIADHQGKILVNQQSEGIAYAEINISPGPWPSFRFRRPEAFIDNLSVYGVNQRSSRPDHIRVAAIQMLGRHSLAANLQQIKGYLAQCSRQGVRVALFPECITTGYYREDIIQYTEKELLDAEETIAACCKENSIYAIIGTPAFQKGERYNTALVISPQGEKIYRQAKIQLTEGDAKWARAGNRLSTFKIDDITCSLIICHDSRYPELVRLPVMKGARLVFYLSWESDIRSELKLDPYRAQVQARAVENVVYIVHANAPQRLSPQLEGSHGQSRIVDPKGNLMKEASIFAEEVLTADLDMQKAHGDTALKSWRPEFLKTFWQTGVDQIGQAP